MGRRLFFLALTLTLTLFSGCALFGSGRPLGEVKLSERAVVINVPVVLQGSEYDCGDSALSMLLAYYGKPCDAAKSKTLREKAEQEHGLTGADLEAYMRSEGFNTALFAGDLGDTVQGIYHHVDRGRPLVVALGLSNNSNHFVLVTGYDPQNDWVLLQDPGRGALVFVTAHFENAWAKARHFTLLATPN